MAYNPFLFHKYIKTRRGKKKKKRKKTLELETVTKLLVLEHWHIRIKLVDCGMESNLFSTMIFLYYSVK